MQSEKIIFLVTGSALTAAIMAMFAWSVVSFYKRCGQCKAANPCSFAGDWSRDYTDFSNDKVGFMFKSPEEEELAFLEYLIQKRRRKLNKA